MDKNKFEKTGKIEIELITLKKLEDYIRGRTKNIVENFSINIGDKEEQVVVEESSPQEQKKHVSSAGVFSRLFFPVKIKEEQKAPKVSIKKDKISKKNPKIIIGGIIFFIILGIGTYVYFDFERLNGWVARFLDKKIEEDVAVPLEIKEPVQYSSLSLSKLLESPEVKVLDFNKPEEKKVSSNFFINIWDKAIKKDQVPETGKSLSKEEVYAFISKDSGNYEAGNIYLVNLYNQEGKIAPFSEFCSVMEFKIYSEKEIDLKKNLVDYRLIFYLEPENSVTENNIRMGIVLIYKEHTPDILILKNWEKTIIKDFSFLYTGDLKELVSVYKEFKDSAISSERRYVNFTSNQEVSLDYAIAEDGLIVATSRNFASAILNLLLENDIKEE